MGDDLDIGLAVGEVTGAVKALTVQMTRMDAKLDAHTEHEEEQFEKGREKFGKVFTELQGLRSDVAAIKDRIKPRRRITAWNRKYIKIWAALIGVLAPFLTAIGFNPEWLDAIIDAAEKM